MSKAKLILIIAVVAVVLLICGVFVIQGPQNHAIELEEQIGVAQSNIMVQEKRRSDLIPNLVDCVKQYDHHEYETLLAVIQARGSGRDDTVKEVQNTISIIAEKYPELKSNENYNQLMTELATTENLIAGYRSNYNMQVKNYRKYVQKFPARLFLSITGYETVDYQYLEYEEYSDAPTNLFD